MSTNFASGVWAIASCDRCGFRYSLQELRELVIKTKKVNIMVCPECYEEDQPQLQLGMYPIDDPQALQKARPEAGVDQSRVTSWGFRPYCSSVTATGAVGTVTFS